MIPPDLYIGDIQKGVVIWLFGGLVVCLICYPPGECQDGLLVLIIAS